MCYKIKYRRAAVALQEPAKLLHHLFYFIAHETRAVINKCCSKMKQNIYFVAVFILFYCTSNHALIPSLKIKRNMNSIATFN